MLIKVSAQSWPVLQHLPGRRPDWNGIYFAINQTVPECDFWVVWGDITQGDSCRCDPRNVILLCGEPPAAKLFYSSRFLAQFGQVLTCNPWLRHQGKYYTAPPIPWRAGIDFDKNLAIARDFDAYVREGIPAKNKLVSVITSTKTITAGQRLRSRLVDYLDQHYSDIVDIYGDGRTHISDKWDALAPYKYHLALENSRQDMYFSEKLTDAFLAGCFPLYYGAPNIKQFFPANSLVAIDVRRPADVAAQLLTLLENDVWTQRLPQLTEARRRVLLDHNFFAVMARLCREQPVGVKQELTILPESLCQSPGAALRTKVANRLYGWFAR